MRTKIIIVEGHRMIAEMWAEVFARRRDFHLIGITGRISEALKMMRSRSPHIVLLDLQLPKRLGFLAFQKFRRDFGDVSVIAIALRSQPAVAKQLIKLGARGYVTKHSSLGEIFKAIDAVRNGETYVCDKIKKVVKRKPEKLRVNRIDSELLTPRELDVMRLMKKGFTTRELAEKLKISVKTVEVHRHNILKKFKMKNTIQLLHMLYREQTNL